MRTSSKRRRSFCRESIREVLLAAARNWLAVAERGGIGPSGGPVLSPRQEAEICVRKGLLNPPDPILLPEAVEEFYKLALHDSRP